MRTLLLLFMVFLFNNSVLSQVKGGLTYSLKKPARAIRENRKRERENRLQTMLEDTIKANAYWQRMNRNALYIVPISYFKDAGRQGPDKTPVGIGIAYERFFNEFLSVKIPIETAFNSSYSRIALTLKLFPKGIADVNYVLGISAFRNRNSIHGLCYNSYGFVEGMYGRRVSTGIALDQILDIRISRKFLFSVTFGPGFNVSEKIEFPREPLYWDDYHLGYGTWSFFNFYMNCSLGYTF